MAEEQKATESKNKVKIKDAGPCKKKVTVEIPEEVIKTAADEQYETLRKDAVVSGFRKGRAPRRLLEKRFGKETSEQVKLKLLADAGDAAVKDNELNILRDPDIDYGKIELPESGSMKFDFEVEVRPEFELPQTEGIPIKKTKLKVTDSRVDEELEQLRKYSGLWTPKDDGEIAADDQVIADVAIKVDDAEEEEKIDDSEIFIRQNGIVAGVPVENLEELLVGAKTGEVKEVTVDVPKTFFKEEYRGKKINLKIAVKEIKFLKPAELNTAFLERLGADSEEKLRDKINESLQSRLEQQVRAAMVEQIYEYILDKTSFDLPTDIVADQATSLLQRQYANLLNQGLPREQLAEQMEKLKVSSEDQAKDQLKTYFIMDKLAEKFDITVTEEEINGHIAQSAMQRGQRPEKMREEMARNGLLTQFELQIRENKCIDQLLQTAKITEVEPKKEAKTTKKTKKSTKKAVKTTKKTAEKSDEKKKETKTK